ncbi:DUF6247 family protein [Nocardia sp. NPDC052566]|uniref:DUF6247 family protein n=1 Tax=Nocardia sp. NPDC052566 TaxID=3364330 RepID=UPI0037C941EC
MRPEPSRVPDADPSAIRACLPSAVAVEFDRNWRAVMDRAKDEQDLTLVHDFLARWRIMAHAEMTDPGSYFRLMEKVDRATEDSRLSPPSGGARVTGADIKAMIKSRLGAP